MKSKCCKHQVAVRKYYLGPAVLRHEDKYWDDLNEEEKEELQSRWDFSLLTNCDKKGKDGNCSRAKKAEPESL